MMGVAHEVVLLVVEGRVEEESVVLDLEMLVFLADPALAERDELLALSEGAHRYSPLFEGNRHRVVQSDRVSRTWRRQCRVRRSVPAQSGGILRSHAN